MASFILNFILESTSLSDGLANNDLIIEPITIMQRTRTRSLRMISFFLIFAALDFEESSSCLLIGLLSVVFFPDFEFFIMIHPVTIFIISRKTITTSSMQGTQLVQYAQRLGRS